MNEIIICCKCETERTVEEMQEGVSDCCNAPVRIAVEWISDPEDY